jgi:hypothetical protein
MWPFKRNRKYAQPTPPKKGPVGIDLQYDDGQWYYSVPSIYVGMEGDCALYEVLAPRDPRKELPVGMSVAALPAKTSIQFPFAGMPQITDQKHRDLVIEEVPDEPEWDQKGGRS